MTAATYTTNLASIFTDGSTSGWTALGGGASGLNQETDFFIQGTSCLSKNAFASSEKGMIFASGSDQGGTPTDGAYIAWITHLTPNSLNSKASGGISFLIGSSTSAYREYYIGGNNTIPFGGWILAAVKEQTTADNTAGSPSSTVESHFGALFDLPSGGPTKGSPAAIDAIRFGRCDIIVQFGTGADPEANFAGILSNLETATNRYGLLAQRQPNGPFESSGLLQLGSSTNAVEFLEENKVVLLRAHDHVTANFHTWEVQNASSIITFNNLVVRALGGASPGRWVTTDNATLAWSGCNFIDMGVFGFLSNATIDGCTFLRCAQITHGGANLSTSKILASSVAANSGAMFYDETSDPDGDVNDMAFSMGANSHHAIEFGTNVPASITLRGIDFSGFGSSDDANDSVFKFNDTGGTITLNLVGCSHDGSGFTVDARAGVTVVVNIDPVTTLVHVIDNTGADLSGASVYMRAADGTGDLPFEESVTISRSGTVATVSHTAHGLNTGEYVKLAGITGNKAEDNNGAHQITFISANSYSFVTDDSGDTSYGGSITATGVTIYGTTDGNGNISTSRTYTNDQPLTGFVRKASSTPRFKSFTLGGTVDNVTGLTINVRMILDQ